MLKLGSKGDEVKRLQSRLNQLGFNCGEADGVFGAKTHDAVIGFQRSRGLLMDGIVGPNTGALLWTPPVGKWTHIVVHHTGAEEKDAEQIRRYHMQSRGWQDIGYNFVIERDGRVVTGRRLDIKGAHCVELNHCGIGVSMIGNMNNHEPLVEQYKALFVLLPDLMKQYGISVGNIKGHGEVSPTACPGKNVDMNRLRVYVEQAMNPPKQAPAPVQDAGGGKFFRVQIGAYKVRPNAEQCLARAKAAGFPDAFIVES